MLPTVSCVRGSSEKMQGQSLWVLAGKGMEGYGLDLGQ